MIHKALAVLSQFYGYKSFYPLQRQVIHHVLAGGDALVLMPTGGGKSLCFQIPALISPGCAIVVTPLLALMKDQVDALQANGIPAAAVNSQQTEVQNREVVEQVYAGRIKLLYISPERLLTELDSWSADMRISLIAIDEAHCISQWGHDFRPEYTRLNVLKKRFPTVPVVALTATADRLTRTDILTQLGISGAKMFVSSFDRPNIRLAVETGLSGKQKLAHITRFIERHPGESGIIYCLRRKNTEDMAASLCRLGFNAKAFHAGMTTAAKLRVQREFINDDTPIICATIAFGMGIDKSNVRWVIHSNMPRNIEGYYQEIGRAGRDGAPAEALMFYNYNDMVTLQHFAMESGQSDINLEKLRRMQQFAEAGVCRRRILLNYFNEAFDHDCHNCDVCSSPPERIDGSKLAQMALSAIKRTHEQVGASMVVDILRASRKAELVQAGYDRLRTYGVGRALSFAEWNAYMLQMLQLGLFDVAYDDAHHLRITPFGEEVLYGRATVQFTRWQPRQLKAAKKKAVGGTAAAQHDTNRQLFELLCQTRADLAHRQGVPPSVVFSDKVLHIMAAELPVTSEQFGRLYGVGEYKAQRYWQPFTRVIAEWKARHHGQLL
ncbi:MAG: DNA helicase RecQ [Muribaculaceae bacterium]|nr:DNA helicase RecQ [Muribaculaceae bacterium]